MNEIRVETIIERLRKDLNRFIKEAVTIYSQGDPKLAKEKLSYEINNSQSWWNNLPSELKSSINEDYIQYVKELSDLRDAIG